MKTRDRSKLKMMEMARQKANPIDVSRFKYGHRFTSTVAAYMNMTAKVTNNKDSEIAKILADIGDKLSDPVKLHSDNDVSKKTLAINPEREKDGRTT